MAWVGGGASPILVDPPMSVLTSEAEVGSLDRVRKAQDAALRALGTEERRGAEPLRGLGERTGPGRVHAGEGGSELGAEGVVLLAAVAPEREELGDDALAALDGVQLQVLEGRAVDLVEAVDDGGAAPGLGNVTAARGVQGVEIACPLGGLHLLCHEGTLRALTGG